jgi:ribose-phosphate pyrophosphokinase
MTTDRNGERNRMELVTKKRLHLVSGRANLPLAEEIAERLGVELGDANLAEFANGELHTRFGESVRGTDVFIIQTHVSTSEMSVNDAIMEQLIMVDAAKRTSGSEVRGPGADHGEADRKHVQSRGREATHFRGSPFWSDPRFLRWSRRPSHRNASSR